MANPGLDSKLSCATRASHKLSLLARDVAFDTRFLHSYHVASVQAHVPVTLIDDAVCVHSVHCDCVTGLVV